MPAMKVEGPGGESDGEDMSGAESDHSGGSNRGPERESSAEEADEPDSDDSSEMDGCECDRRIVECVDNLIEMERHFSVLREQLYHERVTQVESQFAELRSGRWSEYVTPLQCLSDNMRVRMEVASVLRKFRLQNIAHKYNAEEQAAKQNLQCQKTLEQDRIHDELMEKIRHLEEDRHNVDISWADWATGSRASKVRGPGRRKAVTVSGPYIVYMLNEKDIIDDWTIIRKALKRTVPT